ncbi:MMPL family transporter [Arthrobacter castelli]|uniref:MMPL family transporter n=1 Tax=Arthrobacter castelli TaxID=271431 RepID=UPI0004145A11|nr:MMPL family transporter [Arthrobacter castelli]
MASLLYRLGKFCYRNARWVITAWVVAVLAVGGAAAAFSGTLSNSFSIPGTESQRVLNQLEDEMPEATGGSGSIVFDAGSKAFSADQKQAIRDALNELDDVSGVQSVARPFQTEQQLADARQKLENGEQKLSDAKAQLQDGTRKLEQAAADLEQRQAQLDTALQQAEAAAAAGVPGAAQQLAVLQAAQAKLDAAAEQLQAQREQLDDGRAEIRAQEDKLTEGRQQLKLSSGVELISDDGSVAVARVQFDKEIHSVSPETRQQVQDVVDAAEASGIEVHYSKEIVQDISEIFGAAEVIGVLIAAVVLIVMLGTLIAAGLPLLMAITGVAVGVGGTFALSGAVQMSSVSPMLALMLGLAVGIDYSLFIVNRHRTQLLHGMPTGESVGRATGTAGNAVLFAGLTVVIALAALAVPGIPFLTVMGLAGAATVAFAVVVALTLTPAMLRVIGTRLISKRAWAKADLGGAEEQDRAEQAKIDAGRGWGGFVTRHPVILLLITVIGLGAVALPATQLRVGLPDGGSEPADSTAYQAYTTMGQAFGEGINGPLLVAGEMPSGLSDEEAEETRFDVVRELRDIDNVATAIPAGVSEDGDMAIFQVVPTGGPTDQSTEELVHELRNSASGIEDATGVEIGVTGQTAVNIDVSQKLLDALPLYLGIVVGLSLLLLLLVFRSIVVPLLATAGFLLSLAASFGAVVAIYQWGWLGDVFGVHNPGPVLSFLPIIMIGVLFGLAMDYQVFLVSGMREAYMHGESARHAVRSGFSHGARVVTAAAIIMTSVFSGFIFSHLTMIRPIGFGLAFGVLVDAFLIRMVVVPAAMHLLGRSAWWLPRWLDRMLPDVDVEGAKVATETAEAHTPELAGQRSN